MMQSNEHGSVALTDLDLQIAVHYGIPSAASILAFDPIQRLLAIGTLWVNTIAINLIGNQGLKSILGNHIVYIP